MAKYDGKLTPQELEISQHEVVQMELGKNPVTGDPIRRWLYLGCNEIAQLEKLLGGALQFVFADKKNLGMDLTISVLWVGLKVFEPGLEKTAVGRMLSREFTRMPEFWESINEALRRGVPGMFPEESAGVPVAAAPLPVAPSQTASSS